MTDEIVLSASSVATFFRCHYQWYLGNVMRLPAQGNVSMILGSAVHAGAAAFWTSPLRPEAVLEASFTAETANVPPEEMSADRGALADGQRMLATYIREVVPSFRQERPKVEQKFAIRIIGVIWTGIIDAYTKDVSDLKTTAGKTINGRKPSFDPANFQLQLDGYRFGYQALTGDWPRKLLLHVLTRTGKFRQYELQPKPGDFIDTVGVVREAIDRRDYNPTGTLNGSCSYCPYRNSCDYSNARD